MTPSALSTAVSPDDIPASLERVMTVGEPLSQKVSDLWADKVQLQVTYALAECPMLNFSRKVAKGDNPRNPGRPEGTTHGVILKPGELEMVSFGQPGELCFFGDQLADGYYNRQSETENKFVPNPVGPGKLLRTGDQAIQKPDGSYQIQGRIDNQVKINGQRLEPEEIASKLAISASVDGVACTGAKINDKVSLVAVVIQSNGTDWSAVVNELRAQALQSFPSFMVPSYWLRCEAFPKSHNGKIDHKAIRSLVEATDVGEMLGRDPRDKGRQYHFSETGATIRNIWADVIQVEPADIRPTDSFIALGGSSLDSIKVIGILREHDIHLELADMLQGQDVEKVADLAQARNQKPFSATPVGRFAYLKDQELYDELVSDPGVVDAFQLTALQEGILASTLQGNLDYLYQRVFSVGHLDISKLRLAFESAFTRSDILKSTFVYGTRGFVQVLRHDFSLPWTEQSRSLDEYLRDDKETGVTFGEPFFRVALLDTDTLVVSIHHTLFDYWSHDFVFEDVATLFSGGLPLTRPPWRSFVDLVHNRSFEESQMFWAAFLAEAPPTILNNAPIETSCSVDRLIPHIPKSTLTQLGVPSSAIFYGAWALVLSAYVASDTVVMGIAISGRELPLQNIENLDGPTLAMVPQVIKAGCDMSLAQVVQAANKNMWEITKHSQHGIRNAIAAAGHQNIDLFDTMVNIHVRPQQQSQCVKEVFKPAGPQEPWRTEYTTLNLDEGPKGIDVHLTGEVEKCRLEFILDQFCRAVDLIVSNADVPIRGISLMGQDELDFVHLPVNDVNITKTLLGEFEAAAKQYPSRIAVNFKNQELLTYSGLNDKAERMADYLTCKGIKSGDIVPILLGKSLYMIITILALFKVGAAYVALDPENPVERNAFITRELGCRIVLTETKHMNYFASERLHSILVDRANSAPPSDRGHLGVRPASLAYIVFTSGSTGKPKGVVISHGACATAISSIVEYEGKRGKNFRALQFSNYIFDASVYDIFVTLHSGGTLCVAPEEQLLDDLAGTINLMGVTHMFMTPTVARLLDPADVPSLESITVGGEQVTNDVVSKWGVAVALRLAYGPTETSVMVSLKDVDVNTQGSNIGRPLPSVGAIILEANGNRPVPYGGVGELCLMGPQLSEGYINARDLTAAAFFEGYPAARGQRLYRSGDLARYMPGGEIECLGRKDHQVKINGHRIELGEIENALLRTGVVKDCILMVWTQKNTAHLVAIALFKSAQRGGDWSFLPMDQVSEEAEQAKNKLGDLAHYMMPSFILPISSFPQLPSGKTDRKKVSNHVKRMSQSELKQYSFDSIGTSGDSEVIPIATAEQSLLKEAWIEILDVSGRDFGLEANFLSLGGDSISAINLVSCLRRKGLTISVRDVQKNPMLGAMSTKLVRNKGQVESQVIDFSPSSELKSLISTTGLKEGSFKRIYPCLPGQSEFLTQGARPESFWCLMATRTIGDHLRAEQWVELTRKLTETNEILRTTFIRCRGNWYGVVLEDTTPVVEYYDVANPEYKKQVLNEIWSTKFTFGRPFIRYAVLRMKDGEHQVVTKMDHGLYDGTLLRVFGAHFQAYQREEEPKIATTFQDLALHTWQTNQTQPTLDFWKQQDRRPTPFQYPNQSQPQTNAHTFRVIHLDFDEFTRSSGVTVAIIFQTVFQMWLSLRSGEVNVAFDYLYTGRNVDLPDPQNINGPCANFLPMRYDVDKKFSARELLERTSDDFWLYTENGSVGVEEILRACAFSRDKYINQVLFLFQPFEPASASKTQSTSQEWVVLPKSEIRIPQPYAIVCEVKKTADANAYRLSFTYDDRVWSSTAIEEEITAIEKMLAYLMKHPGATVGEILKQGEE